MEKGNEDKNRYCEREKLFKEFGYDIKREKAFIINKVQPVEGEILELGTGEGHFAVALAQKGYRFTTVDISLEKQEMARTAMRALGVEAQATFVINNAEQLPFADERYTIAFGINLVHHLDDPFKVIDELIRVISRNGKIILSDFNKAGFEIINRIHQHEKGHGHDFGKHTLKDVECYLAEKKFSIEKFETACQETILIHKKEHGTI